MDKEDKYSPPTKKKLSDAAHTITRTILGTCLPAAATELLNTLVTPSLERRREEWMKNVGNGLRKLEENQRINVEGLL